MTEHHHADGCHGEERPLTPGERHAIRERAGEMLIHLTAGRTREVLRCGAWVALHCGPEGEWALALDLVNQVTGLTPLGHCDDDGTPLLAKAFTLDDERVQSLAHHCAAMFPSGKDHNSADVDAALARTAPLVQRFALAYKLNRQAECRALWEEMYAVAFTKEGEDTRELVLRAGAATALLTTWAARYSVHETII